MSEALTDVHLVLGLTIHQTPSTQPSILYQCCFTIARLKGFRRPFRDCHINFENIV